MLIAVPLGTLALLVTWTPAFMILTTATVFFLSAYNGPAGAVVDELGPPQIAATLQAVFMFGIQLLGNATAASVVGWMADRTTVANALLSAVAAYGVAGLLFVWVARRQRRAAIVAISRL
jgi:MFS family permease